MSERARSRDVKRAELPAEIPRPSKRRPRKRSAHRPPLNIRVSGVELSAEERSYIHRKVGMKLGKFSPSVERITVRVGDDNGPRGGVDKVCTVKVVVGGLPSLIVERRSHALRAAIDGSLDATVRAVRKTIQQRRATSRKPGANGPSGRSSAAALSRRAATSRSVRPARTRRG
jgi:ribosome-associated translation inhibitor RaiA